MNDSSRPFCDFLGLDHFVNQKENEVGDMKQKLSRLDQQIKVTFTTCAYPVSLCNPRSTTYS